MWELDHKEDRTLKNWYFWTVVLEKTLESPMDSKEIKPVNPKGNQPWIFIGRTEAPILWPPDVKSLLVGKDPDAGKDWGQEMGDRGWDGWMALLTQWTWDSEGQGSLVCYSPWGCKESNMIKWLNNSRKTIVYHMCISSLKKNNSLLIVQA